MKKILLSLLLTVVFAVPAFSQMMDMPMKGHGQMMKMGNMDMMGGDMMCMEHAESYEVGTGLTLGAGGGERRAVRLNGVAAQSSADLGEIVQMTWLTPAMDRLFSEGASGRRKFIDRLVLGFEPAHGRRAARYETAMRERGKLLKFGPRDPMWLDGLETEMAEAGAAMARAAVKRGLRLSVGS